MIFPWYELRLLVSRMIRGIVCRRWAFHLLLRRKQGTEPDGQFSIVQAFIEQRLDGATEIDILGV